MKLLGLSIFFFTINITVFSQNDEFFQSMYKADSLYNIGNYESTKSILKNNYIT